MARRGSQNDPIYESWNTGERPEKSGGLSEWIFPLIMLFLFPPVGVLLLVLKIFTGGSRKTARGRHPYYAQQEGQTPVGARTAATAPAKGGGKKAGSVQAVLSGLDRRSRRLMVVGGVVAALFAIAMPSVLGEIFYWLFEGEFSWAVQEFFNGMPVMILLAAGLGALWAGLRGKKQLGRFRNYLAMVGKQPSVSISALASAAGLPPSKVRDDLSDMLEAGLFPKGFLDYGGDRLVLSGEGLKGQVPPEPASAPQPKPAPGEEENAVLAEIRAVNDSIAHEHISEQIDRIGVVTAKIFDYQKTHPEKSPQLHSFLSYYLPTTLKILRAYAQLEAQGIEGENITAAKQRIEGMMDKVVEGFEKQLDQLFQGDAMDITTDVQVLEQMLAKDGLSSGDGLQLGI